MSDPLFPGDTAEESDLRDERAWESLRSTDRDDPDRMRKALEAYLQDPSGRESP